MKCTLDHNCLIALKEQEESAIALRSLLERPDHQCFVVNVGASEMQKYGVIPDNYAAFERLLEDIEVDQLPRLDPIGVCDVTFVDRCIWASAEDCQLLVTIQGILFEAERGWRGEPSGVTLTRRERNRLCDALSVWCHIHYGSDVFVSMDGNFLKHRKLAALQRIGVEQVWNPRIDAGHFRAARS